mmetsp:Transcript_22075/g.39334  ORF Transcript_22075/g.39334 Transcript_22075/m.39334 type:complete len:191 (-) Transcript_22075:209-781(-)
MMMIRISTLVVAVLCILKNESSFAFVQQTGQQKSSVTSLSAESCNRREAFFGMAAAAMATVSAVVPVEPAAAKYSDYSRREKDWQERQAKGDVKYSSAKDLRKQLAEIVPQNSEGSKVFCPNGPSAAVSPLMENKCSDTLMALPSVYGRTNDSMGNSIPGFQSGYDWSSNVGASSSITSAVGGFPGYYKK